MRNDFAAFILTHGRPEAVYTYSTLRDSGYTGKIFLILDDQDKTIKKYQELYGDDEVIVFDKKAWAAKVDSCDNFLDMRATIYARNASFEIAEQVGIKYFIQLDDDYTSFQYRFNSKAEYDPKSLRNLDKVFEALLKFFISSGAMSVAIAQGGDFIGGEESSFAQKVQLKRKAMNSWICSTHRPFTFTGRMNDDVNTYLRLGNRGGLFFTVNQVNLNQVPTQKNPGGMTEIYLNSGTYVKSFYSVMHQPSSVRVKSMNPRNPRLHHNVNWDRTVPKILRESTRRTAKQ